MIKTSSLTKTLFNHQNQSQPINLYTPSTTSSSGSACETDPSSLSSSYKSNIGTNINDEMNTIAQDESTLVLMTLIDKLKHELATVKQAKNQLASLYKVSARKLFLFVSLTFCFSFLISYCPLNVYMNMPPILK